MFGQVQEAFMFAVGNTAEQWPILVLGACVGNAVTRWYYTHVKHIDLKGTEENAQETG